MSVERRRVLSRALSGVPLLLLLAGVRAAVADTCSFQLTADNTTIAAAGGTGTILVNAVGNGCAWAASSNVDWVAIQPGTLSSARITFSVQPNSGSAPRTGTIQVAGNLVQLVQTGSSVSMPFQDLDPTSPDADYILLTLAAGVMGSCGANNNSFCPNDAVTRAGLAQVLVRAIEGSDTFSYSLTPVFADVPASHPSFSYVQKANELGLFAPCSDGKFCPDQAVTRGEAAGAAVLGRGGANWPFSAAPYFSDVAPGSNLFPSVQRLMDKGFDYGCSATQFCPDDPVNRSEAARLVVRSFLTQLTNTRNIFLSNATDPQVMETRGVDGSVTALFGEKLADGTTSQVNLMTMAAPGSPTVSARFDSEGRLSQFQVDRGDTFTFAWNGRAGFTVDIVGKNAGFETVVRPEGPFRRRLPPGRPVRPKSMHSGNVLTASRARPDEISGSATSNQVAINVSACNGQEPVEDATVTLNVTTAAGGSSVPADPVPGTGTYLAKVPVPDPSAGQYVREKFLTAQEQSENICQVVEGLDGVQGGGDLFCASLASLAAAVPQLQGAVSEIGEFCQVGLEALGKACKAVKAGDFVGDVVDRANTTFNQPHFIQAVATLPDGTRQASESLPFPPASQPTISFGSVCRVVDHLDLTPASATIGIGNSVSMTATPKTASGAVVQLPLGRLMWAAAPENILSLSGSADNQRTVTGVKQGMGAVSVVETKSQRSASSAIKVACSSGTQSLSCFDGNYAGNVNVSGTFNGESGSGGGTLSFSVNSGVLTVNGNASGSGGLVTITGNASGNGSVAAGGSLNVLVNGYADVGGTTVDITCALQGTIQLLSNGGASGQGTGSCTSTDGDGSATLTWSVQRQ